MAETNSATEQTNRTKPSASLSGTVLGFDFGLKRIGVAVGQTVTQTASPLTVLKSRDGVPDWPAIMTLIADWKPVALVVGLPLRLDGTEQPFTQNARKFGQRLQGRSQKPLFFMQEQLSSIEAEQRLKAGATGLLDAHAAQILLENWLNKA
jgi:putative Holliday junction resolvase